MTKTADPGLTSERNQMTVIPERGDSMNAKRRSTMNDDPSQLVKAPGQGGDLVLTRGTVVEADWPTGSRLLCYVDEGGYQILAGHVGNGMPLQWSGVRIVRVLTEEKPAHEPVLPRPIKPADVRVGMVIEQRKGVCIMRGRVVAVEDGVFQCEVAWLRTENEPNGWSLRLIEDAPAPFDPDAAAVEALVTAYRRSPECSTDAVFGEAMLDNLRAQGFDVTPRAEQ